MAKRIGGGLLLLLASIGLILCLITLFGVWQVRTQIVEIGTAAAPVARDYLLLADSGLTQIDGTLDEVQLRLSDADSKRYDELLAELAERVRRLAAFGRKLHEGLVKLNKTLVLLNRLPGSSVPTITNELATLDQELERISGQLDELRGIVARTTIDQGAATALIARTSSDVGNLQARLSAAQASLNQAAQALDLVEQNLANWTASGATLVSLLALLFAAGQVSLILNAIRWLRQPA